LQQIEYATSSTNSVLEGLRLYKQRGRHLVICLSGDKPIDLRKHFLHTLRKALESEGIVDSIAQQICKQPLQYLERLDAKQRDAAEAYLKRLGNPEGDVAMLMELLQEDNYQIIPRIKEICYHQVGFNPDFEADVDVEALLTDLVTRLCLGENPHFQGILILFDELYNYLQLWASDPIGAGSTAIQNITNICERFKGRVALISFAQRRLSGVIPSKNVEDYNRLASRLELLPSTYEPAASLELVLSGLLSQQSQTAAWHEFRSKWDDTLRAENTTAYENRTANYYRNRNWSFQKFHEHIGLGCFPLHPITSYLLCNLNFTHGRTAIQFVQDEVKRFLAEQPAEKDGNLNYIYPVALVDAFESDFSRPQSNPEYPRLFADYRYAVNKLQVSADADPNEIIILKALFLFHASGSKLAKSDREKHEEILSLLAGISVVKVKTALDKLRLVREVVYHNPASNTYQFYSGGIDPEALRRRIREETANTPISINKVEEHCLVKIKHYVGSETFPTQFIEENRLCSEDWQFQNKVYSVARFRQALFSDQTLRTTDALGIVAYVMAETSEETLALRCEIDQLLAQSHLKGQMVVAIAVQPAGELARLLLEFENAEKKSVQEFGVALTQLQEQYKKQIHNSTSDLFKSCTYHCHIQEKIPTGDRTHPTRILSAVLQDRYPLVPPVEKIDKMVVKKGGKGGEIIGYTAKRLLEDDLRPQAFPQQSYANTIDPVFVKSWRLLQKTSQKYSVIVPTHPKIAAAWNEISEMMTLDEQSEKSVEITKIWKTLSSPPYGYNEYTFTLLFAGWLAYYRAEVWLKGSFGIPQKQSDQIAVKTEPITTWAGTNILDKPKEFVNKWIENYQPRLIRRKPVPEVIIPASVDYELAQQLIQQIDNFLSSGVHASTKVNEHHQKRELLTAGVERIDELMEPVLRAETLLKVSLSSQADIEPFVRLYTDIQLQTSINVIDGLSINFTEQQQGQRKQTLQAIIERIGQAVEVESERYQSLHTEADCGAYKANIQHIIFQIRQITDLPSRFIEILQDALRNVERIQGEIEEQRKVDAFLSQIQGLYDTLSNNATQDEYRHIQAEIEKLVEGIPTAKNIDRYRNITQALEEKQDGLIRQVAHWESQYSPTILKAQAVQLSQEINRQLDRFTDETSKQRLNELLKHLENIILEHESEEQEEEQLQAIISNARRKSQDITTLKNLSDAFQAYQELSQLTLPTTAKSTSLEEKQNQLETIKSEGYRVISGKFSQIIEGCNRRLNQTSEFEQLKSWVQRSQTLVASCDEFAAIRNSLEEAERNLEAQYQDLQQRLKDTQTLQAIRQHTLAKANTIYLCEEAIAAIENLRKELNFSEQLSPEIDKLLCGFRDKIANHNRNLQSLRDRLPSVKNYKQVGHIRDEYAKLDLIFKDSSDYPAYLQLQEQIRLLEEDLERILRLESLCQQSQSITACDDALKAVSNERESLRCLDRFGQKLLEFEELLRGKKQGYINYLDQLQGKLASVATLKEAHQLQRELGEKSAYYRESQEQKRYELLSLEVNQLVNLLQIAETQKVNTVQSCQTEIERLLQWRDTTEKIAPIVQTLLESLLQKLEQTRQQIQEQQKRTTTNWVEALENQVSQLEQLPDAVSRLDAASQLLKQIKNQRSKHDEILQRLPLE